MLRRSPRLAARRLDKQAAAPDATISTPVHAALIQQRVGGASLFDQVETVVKSHFPRLEAAVVTAESRSKLSRHHLVTRKLKVYDEEIGLQVPLLVGPVTSQLNRETSEVSGPPEKKKRSSCSYRRSG